jgi:hypothetical protein
MDGSDVLDQHQFLRWLIQLIGQSRRASEIALVSKRFRDRAQCWFDVKANAQ